MNRKTIVLALSLLAMIPAAATGWTRNVTPAPDEDDVLALVGAKVYISPTDPPISNATILIRGGKIESVGKVDVVTLPESATQIDCKSAVITAGFQNSHVHFTESKWAYAQDQPASELQQLVEEMLTRYGFTTVVDTGSLLPNTVAIRKRIEVGDILGPRILTAGGPLYPPDGIPYYLSDIPPEIRKMMAQPATPVAAVAAVDDDLAGGADIIKLFTGSWIARGKVKPMPIDVASAAVNEAHKNNKLVFTHPSNVAGLQVALDAHVDVLAHSIEDMRGWNDSYLARMKAAKMSLIPTLKLFAKDDDLPGILNEVMGYQRIGGQIVFGTDVGYLSDYNPADEYELLSRAGLTPMQILAALTIAPAERFGESEKRGRIAAGMQADLVVLEGDPAQEATNFARVRYTIRRGQVLYPPPAN
jgi:imidazolonepropionase-like amidohydrolase